MTSRGGVRHTRMTDETAFAAQLEPHRRELQVHCYRMLGSLDEAEDLVQETFLRAWHKRASYEGRATVRAWLYKIATNACLDLLARNKRRLMPSGAGGEPVRGAVAPAAPGRAARPGRVERGGSPRRLSSPRRRSSSRLPRRDPAPATAAAGGADPARRAGLVGEGDRRRCSRRASPRPTAPSSARATGSRSTCPSIGAGGDPSEHEQALLRAFMDAHERADATGIAHMLRDDVRVTCRGSAR